MKWRRMPIFSPIIELAKAIRAVFFVFPLWLVGYWWCEECNERFGPRDDKVIAQGNDVCPSCFKKNFW